MYGKYSYYELSNADGSSDVVYTDNTPCLGRRFDPISGEYYGPEIIGIREMTEKETQEKYPNELKTLVTWFGFEEKDRFGKKAWLVNGTPTNARGCVLNKHSKKRASNDRYDVWEVDAPFKIQLPDGSYIWGNERDEDYELMLIDKVDQKVYFVALPIDTAPIKRIKEWLGSHSF